jgi:hypothetical protein
MLVASTEIGIITTIAILCIHVKSEADIKKPAKTAYMDMTVQKEEKDSDLPQAWIKIGTVQLSRGDKDILLRSRTWLNDNIIKC